MTRADGTLTASWPAVSGVTSYHVTYSSTGGASWELAALNHSATSITFGVDNAKTYIVGVRAKNGNGGGGWRNSPSAGPYTPPTPDPTPTPTPTPAPPDAVASVSVTRADGTLTASWDAPSGATSYHVTYTDDGAQSWQLAALDHAATSITITADNSKTYIVGVRAKNAQGGSGWRNSPASGPFTPPTPDPTPTPTPTPTPAPPDAVASVSVTRADGTLTASWDAPSGATSYHVTYTDDNAQSWQLAALNHTENSITITADNSKSYIVGVRAKNAQGGSNWRNSPAAGPFTPSPTLTPTEVTDDSATIQIDNYDGQWYYTTTGGDGQGASAQSVNCQGPVNGSEATITGLDPDTNYTITAYGNGQCGGASIASGNLVTGQSASLTLTNTGLSTATIALSGHSGNWRYKADKAPFTGCSSNWVSGGGTANLTNLGTGTTYTFTAYSGQYCSSGYELASQTFTTTGPVLRLIENNATDVTVAPHTTWGNTPYWYESTSGDSSKSNCQSAGVTGSVKITGLNADQEFTVSMYDASGCNSSGLFGVIAITTATPTLSVSFNGASAVIAIQKWNRDWGIQQSARAGSCANVSSGSESATFDNLTPGSTYTYEPYDNPGCSVRIAGTGTGITFTVPKLTVAPGPLSASLSMSHWSGQWWYRAVGIYSLTTGNYVGYTGKACRGPAQGSDTAVLTGLESDYTWGFKAYSSYADCDADYHYANSNADDSRATGVLGAVPVKASPLATSLHVGRHRSDNAAETHVLTLHPWGANNAAWYYRVTAVNPGSGIVEGACTGPVNGASATIASRPPLSDNSSYYIYSAHRRSDCRNDIAWVKDSSPVALNLTKAGTSATLSIANWSGNWWYSADTGPHTTCQGPVSATSASLTGLTLGTRYTYTAHGDSACSSAPATYAFTAAHVPPGPVTNIYYISFNNEVGWTAPSEQGTGPGLSYDVECTADGNTWTRVVSGATPNPTRITHTDQQCSVNPYDFRVRAKNGVDGPWATYRR